MTDEQHTPEEMDTILTNLTTLDESKGKSCCSSPPACSDPAIKALEDAQFILDEQPCKSRFAAIPFEVLQQQGWSEDDIRQYQREHADIQKGVCGDLLMLDLQNADKTL